MAPPEVQSVSSAEDVGIYPAPLPHITSNNSIGYFNNSPETLPLTYVPEEAEEIEIFDCPWDPEVRRKLGMDPLPAFFNKES